jgi:hypothetical protein
MGEDKLTTEDKPKRGLARLSPEERAAIAGAGGRAAHAMGRGHEWTSAQAREAGRLGGKRAHESGKGHRFTTEEAKIAGAKGGKAKGARAKAIEAFAKGVSASAAEGPQD